MGGEMRYFRSYAGAGLETFTGQALYVGPTDNLEADGPTE
jgi:hypothetical protein